MPQWVLASRRANVALSLQIFVAYQKTALRYGEILKRSSCRAFLHIPSLRRTADGIKFSKRREMDISTVAAALCGRGSPTLRASGAAGVRGSFAAIQCARIEPKQAIPGKNMEPGNARSLC